MSVCATAAVVGHASSNAAQLIAAAERCLRHQALACQPAGFAMHTGTCEQTYAALSTQTIAVLYACPLLLATDAGLVRTAVVDGSCSWLSRMCKGLWAMLPDAACAGCNSGQHVHAMPKRRNAAEP